MKINRPELVRILKAVKPGLGKSDTKSEITASAISSFIFTGTEIVTFNEQLCIHYPYETEFKTNVHSKGFFALLDKCKEDEIDVYLEEEDRLIVKSPTMGASLNTTMRDEFVFKIINGIINDVIDHDFNPLPKDFLGALSLSKITDADFIHIEKNDLCCYSFAALSIYEFDEDMESFFIDIKTANELSNYNPDSYLVTDNWVHFINEEDVVLSAKRLNPDSKKDILFFKGKITEQESTAVQLTMQLKSLVDEIDLVSVLSSEYSQKQKTIQITLSKGEVMIYAQNEFGSITKNCKVDYKGGNRDIFVDPTLLLNALKLFDKLEDTVILDMTQALSFSSDRLTHVIMKKIAD